MSHRRPSRPTPAPSKRRAPSDARRGQFGSKQLARAEFLERRRMLTTLGNFGQIDPNTGLEAVGEQTFVDGGGSPSVIFYRDVTFEVIGAHRQVTATEPAPSLDDLAPYPEPATAPDNYGTDVFKIYVTESAPDSFISITHFSPRVAGSGGPPFTLSPYGGGPAIGVPDAAGLQVAGSTLPTSGGILIGGVFLGPVANSTATREELTTSLPYPTQFGLQPGAGPTATLTAGIEDLATDASTGLQNDFGNMTIGGTVTGDVSFGANVNEFYAGAIYTGLIGGTLFGNGASFLTGVAGISEKPSPANFSVAGDLRELVTSGNVGTDGKVLTAADGNDNNDPGFFQNESDFDLVVGGTVGEIHLGGTLGGTVTVANDPSISGQLTGGAITGLRTATEEVEDVALTDPDEATNVAALGLANAEDSLFAVGSIQLTNDTLATAQILGTITRTDAATGLPLRDANGNILTAASVTGSIQILNGDDTDFYGVAMKAGAVFQVYLTAGSLKVYDPDGQVIQSNVEVTGDGIQVKATEPGIYKFQVSATATTDYQLSIYSIGTVGLGDMAIGGIIVGGDYDDLGIDGGIAVIRGDLGAIDITGTYYSLTDGPTVTATVDPTLVPTYAPSSIIVADGDLRALIAGNLGETPVSPNVFYSGASISTIDASNLDYGPILNIPAGGVGLIQTTGLMNVYTQFDPNYLQLATPQWVTNTAYAKPISGTIQVIDAGTEFDGWLGVDGTIGTIRAGNMASATPSQIQVNVDNVGNDGIIDLIDVTGNFGVLGGGPVITTNTNGHVRYLKIGGAIFLPAAYGGLQDQATVYAIGQAAVFTDDAGNRITATPVGVTTTTVTTGTTSTLTTVDASGNATTTTVNGVSTTTYSPGPGELDTFVTDATGAATLTTVIGPQVSVLSYPDSGKGGQIPISISVASGKDPSIPAQNDSASLVISATGANGAGTEVDIGSITISGLGRAISNSGATDVFGNLTLIQNAPNTSSGSTATTGTTTTGTTTTTTATTTTGLGAIAAGTPLNTQSLVSSGNGDTTDLFLLINGPATVNVLNVTSMPAIGAFVGTFNFLNVAAGATANDTDIVTGTDVVTATSSTGVPVAIVNSTAGEIANLNSPGVGTLQVKGNLGFTTPVGTPAAVLPRAVALSLYPFGNLHNGVSISGSAVNINVSGSVGNVKVSGDIQNLIADFGNHPAAGVFSGITGPIEATRMLYVQIGQGLIDTGTGQFSQAGLYATNKIGEVTNAGVPDGDIRGDIVVEGVGNVTNSVIDSIKLSNASIIDSHIWAVGDADGTAPGNAAAFSESSLLPGQPSTTLSVNGNPVAGQQQYDIARIGITGAGGVLSSSISAGSIGPIVVGKGGFGVLATIIAASAAGRVGGITAAGYGVRDTSILNSGYVGAITATGNGSSLPVTAFSLDLRPGDVTGTLFDQYNGNALTALEDLNAALGGTTSAASPTVANVTDTGVIEDLLVSAFYDVTGISAQTVRTALPVTSTNVSPLPSLANIPVVGTPFADSITTGGTVGYVRVRSLIDGLQVTAGNLGQFTQTGDVNRLGIDVAGAISSLTVHGNLGAVITDPATGGPERDSYIIANGQSGHIDHLTVYGNLYADVTSSKYIGTVNIHGDLDGVINIQGVSTTHQALNSLIVSGAITDGSLNVAGAVGTISTGGSLGVAGQALTVAGPIKKLIVGSAHAANAALALDLTVYGTVGSMVVNGAITGNVDIKNDLQSLTVNGVAGTNGISGNLSVEGQLTRATVNNSNVASTIIVTGDVGTFTINRGSLLGLASIQSLIGSISNVRDTGGNIDGSIIASNGTNLNVTTTGSFGDGTDVATILALSGGSLSIGGNVESAATATIAGALNNLFVGGTVQTGGTVSGHPVKHVRIGTTPTGTVITT